MFFTKKKKKLNCRIPNGSGNDGVKWVQREMAADFLQLVKYYKNNEYYVQ